MTTEQISLLIQHQLLGTITADEETTLREWCNANVYNKKVYDELTAEGSMQAAISSMREADYHAALAAMQQRIAAGADGADQPQSRWHVVLHSRLLRIAAMVVIIAGISVLGYDRYMHVTPVEVSPEIAQTMETAKTSGLSAATVINGKTSALPRAIVKMIQSVHLDADVRDNLLAARDVETSHSKEYWLTLPDGTLVHLAPGTRLVYPDRFRGSTRDVFLSGMAYFHVGKSHGSRFVVHTQHGDIREYGTEFFVDTDADNGMQVSLLEGSISIQPNSSAERKLAIGEEATIGADASVSIHRADVDVCKAWNLGRMEFTAWPVSRVMSVIAKWYGYRVDYTDDALRDVAISGNFDRFNDIATTLDAVSAITGFNITVSGNRINVRAAESN